MGGWPGALFAQERFRHKTRKATFQAVFWLTVALNGTGLAWAMTQDWHVRLPIDNIGLLIDNLGMPVDNELPTIRPLQL